MKFQVIIPARANSQRLPGKNMRKLGDRHLIEYSIDYALSFFPDNSIWVNSDDLEVINLAREKGVQTLIRPQFLANDNTPTVDVLKFQLKYFQEQAIKCDAIILLQPTNPFRDVDLLKIATKTFLGAKRNSLATFSPSRRKLGKIANNSYEPLNYLPGQRSQDLEILYFENGLLYITKCDSILEGKIITDDVIPIIVDSFGSSIDIDYLEDFQMAEAILKINRDE